MKKITIQDFLKPQRSLVFKSKNGKSSEVYKLQPYNLSFHCLIYNEFASEKQPNGTVNFINRLSSNDPMVVTKAIYLLIEDKSKFTTLEEFTKYLDNFQNPIYDMQIILNKVFEDSLPRWNKKKSSRQFSRR